MTAGRPGSPGSGVSTAVMVAAALALAGCGGGGGGGAPAGNGGGTQMSAYATAVAAIAAATTDAAVDKAVADATASVSGAELARLQTEAAKRKTALATAARKKVQTDALMAASTRLDAAIKALQPKGDGSTVEQFTAATEALAELEKAIADAADLTAAQKKVYMDAVASAKGRDLEKRRVARIVRAITDTEIKAVRDVVANNADDATDTIAKAKERINAEDIPDAEKGKLLAKVGEQEDMLDNQTRIAGIVEAITDGEIAAVGTAIELIDGLSEESTVTDAEAAVDAAKAAIEAADIPDLNKEVLRARLTVREDALAAARTARMDAHKMGRALYAAMGPSDDTTAPVNALNNLATVPYYITSITDSQHDAPAEATGQRGERGDFRIDPAAGAGSIATANTHTAVYFRHGMPGRPGHDTAMDKVGRWGVTHYERTTGSGSMKVTDRVRVYNDRQGGPLERWGVVPMDAAKFFKDDTDWINKGTYTPADRKLSLGTGVDRAIASPKFDTWTVGIGSVTAPKPADGGAEIKVSGTYYGAKGTYFCPVSGTCTVGTGVGGGGFGGYFLSADWYFVHETGAKVLERDLSYMYFGWWVRNDADGMPAAVSAFYQAVGGGVELATDGKSLNVNRGRAATYEGPAIGWYAINDPLNEKGDGGEFTATAKLKAQFGTANLNADTGLTGTIDRFRLKGGSGDPGWSVTLNKAAWTTDPSLATDAQKGHIVNTEKTVWSINGVKAAPAGSWVANLYDDKPGTVENGGDGSNHPTAIMGKWQAGHGGTHRMVGAFGTELQAP